jgi:hypothetical protein
MAVRTTDVDLYRAYRTARLLIDNCLRDGRSSCSEPEYCLTIVRSNKAAKLTNGSYEHIANLYLAGARITQGSTYIKLPITIELNIILLSAHDHGLSSSSMQP